MVIKTSPALLAAMLAMAVPAFAQTETDSATEEMAPVVQPEAEAGTVEAEASEGEAMAEDAAGAADETAADAEPATAPAEAEAAPADAESAAPAEGEAEAAATDEPQVGAYYVKATHTDWTIRCIKAQEGLPDPCELYQLLQDEQGNSVAEITLIPLTGEAAAGATFVAPLETDLVRGMGLQIDNSQPRAYPFNFCAPVGCVSRMGFDNAGLNSLKRGNKATVSLLPFGGDPQNPVALDMSLSGFTAAFAELEGIAAAAEAQLAARAEEEAAAAAESDAEAPAESEAETTAPAEGEAAPAEAEAPAN